MRVIKSGDPAQAKALILHLLDMVKSDRADINRRMQSVLSVIEEKTANWDKIIRQIESLS